MDQKTNLSYSSKILNKKKERYYHNKFVLKLKQIIIDIQIKRIKFPTND